MLKTANSCWRDHPDVVHDFTALIKKTVTETVDAAKKKKKGEGGGESLQDVDLGEIGELTEDDLLEVSARR